MSYGRSDDREYERREEERRRYHADVTYDVWRSNRNPDDVNYERVRDSFYEGLSSGDAAAREIHAQRPRERQQTEEEYYADQCPPEEYPQEEACPPGSTPA